MIALDAVTLETLRPRGLWRREREVLLDSLSFTVTAGEVTVLAGASGLGKTLLARAILGVLPPGVRCRGHIARPAQLAYLPQAISHLDPTARVGRQIGRAGGGAGAWHDSALPRSHARRYPHELSGGEAKRALAALMPEAPAIIADEPTAGLDPATAAHVMGMLQRRAREGAAVLVITHDLCTALPFADGVLLLSGKHLCARHAPCDFTADGENLSPPARRFWRALPQNGFHHD